MSDEASKESLGDNLLSLGVTHYEELRGYFRLRIRGQHDVEDLTQETYARFLKSSARQSVDRPRSFLFRIARNLLTDRIRRKESRREELIKASELAMVEASQAGPRENTFARDELEIARSVVERLPKRCRAVFVLSRFGGLTYEQIAERQGISISTVEKHIIAGLAAVKEALKERC